MYAQHKRDGGSLEGHWRTSLDAYSKLGKATGACDGGLWMRALDRWHKRHGKDFPHV